MAYIANTAIQPKVNNGAYNGLQNVTGKFGSFSGETFTPDVCPAGFMCVPHSLLPLEGYTGRVNGNSWYMVKATDGSSATGKTGDHTGIYVANTYDVQRIVSANGEAIYNLGLNTLGLPIPADERGDFSELIVGEQWKFGVGNFASAPTVGQYVEIANGLFGASSATAPQSGVYGKVLRAEAFNEGASYFGDGYVVEICRAVA